MDNRRKHPRVDRALRINLRFTSARDFVAAYTKDISLGGVAIRTQAKLDVGARLTLVLDLGDRRISVVGEVVWRRPDAQTDKAAVGIRFREMDPVYREWLSQAVETYRAQQSATAAPSQAQPDEALPLSTVGESPPATDRGHQLRAPVGADQLHGRGQESLDLGFEAGGSTLGIDLGTSNCCACIVRDGAPVIIDLGDPEAVGPARKRTLPSAVFFDERGAQTVGQAALDGLIRDPGRTVFGAKRFIGRPYDSPAVHQMLGRFPYKIVPAAQGRAGVEVDGRTTALTDISATLLRAIKDRAAAQLSEPIHRAIITVPAYYNENQRAAVVQAGMRAGLTVERILNEPTAAAIAYGVAGEGERNILVYDLGGGTFDVSVMAARGASLQVLATGGDTFLGGEDFDQAIVAHVVERFEAESGQRLSQNLRARAVIKAAAESAKRRLSLHDKAMVTVREVTLLKGGTSRLEVELDRATVEQLAEPLVARTLRIANLTLAAAGLQASELDEVLLVGGQTRMPYVQRRVTQELEIQPRGDLDPDEVVALGAGMLADIAKSKAVSFSDVLSMTIGVDVGGAFRPLLPRNTPLPCSKSVEVSVPRDKLAIWAVEVYQGDNEKLHANEHLGTLRVDAVGAGPEDPVRLRIDVELSADCLLQFTITNMATGESQAVVLLTSDI